MTLGELWERGQARWLDLPLPRERFEASVRAHVPDEQQREGLWAEDLFLACACTEGIDGAAARFQSEYRDVLARHVATIEHRAGAAAEIVQDLLVALLVGPPPRLAGYSGRGPLRAWLRMIAVRSSLNAVRDAGRQARMDARFAEELVRGGADPELAIIKASYESDFQAAFHDAVASLPPAERALLRLCYGEALSLDGLAAMHGWSRPTASRRVAAARAALLDGVHRLLQQRLRVTESELESLVRVMRSTLEVSLAGLLDEASEP